MRVRHVIAGTTALIIAASTIWLVLDLHGAVPEAPAPIQQVRQRGSAESVTQGLAARRSGLDPQVSASKLPELPAPAPTRTVEDAGQPVPTRDERRQIALDAQRRTIAALDARMQGGEDRLWAGELRGQLAEAGDSALAVQSVACRGSLCRADLLLDDPAAIQRFVDRFSQGAPRVFSLFYERDGGKLKTTLYLARPGTAMPDLRKELAGHS